MHADPPVTLRPRLALLPDLAGLALIALVIVSAEWYTLHGRTAIGLDAATFFYPMYSYLGERLRSGQIPAWNPYQYSGVPFAADPQSGWMYLPAMAVFAVLPLEIAARSYMLFHLLLAGFGAYALARVLGMRPPAGVVAALALSLNGFLFQRNTCCFAYPPVMGWLPVSILGAELAIRARGLWSRAAWWAVSGFAVSQILAVWLGQGGYYALLALGAYIAYRMLVSPPARWSVRGRLGRLLMHGAGVLVFGFGLSMGGLLPRLEYNRLSTLAGGYSAGQTPVNGGWTLQQAAGLLDTGNASYMGWSVLLLALAGLPLARRRWLTPFWLLLALGTLTLAFRQTTPLHSLLYLVLPGFQRLHPHNPERVLMVFYLAAGMLAAAAVQELGRTKVRLGLAEARRIVPLAAVLLVVLDLSAAGRAMVSRELARGAPFGYVKVDFSSYYDPGGAGRFLMGQPGEFRYFGYDLAGLWRGVPYRHTFPDSRNGQLLVNNRGIMFGLQDIQGYNPIQLVRYAELMNSINGAAQEYRSLYVLDSGLGSPLLNLLNARYIVAPSSTPRNRADLAYLRRRYPVVAYRGKADVLENRDALPRAWIVHSARRAPYGEALRLLDTGAVDPRSTVLLEEPPPGLAPAAGGAEAGTVLEYSPERVRLRAEAASDGMLVTSDIYYPAWKAYIDGRPAKVYAANHAFRAVAVPAGTHTVEFRYESGSLTLGIVLSALFALAGAAVGAVALLRWCRSAGRAVQS